MAPMYQTLSTPTPPNHPQHSVPGSGTKRPRPSDLDLSVGSMGELEHSDLSGMQTPLGAAYAHAAAVAVSQSQHQPIHHHHHLPDSEPPSKMMRRDDGLGGAPSVVGQVGMPEPAPRPRGPKLKFTPEDDQLLIELKENKNLTWKQIADFFPGRSSGTLQVRYCTKLKAKTTNWTDETVCLTSLCSHHKNNALILYSGPKASNCTSGLREREMENRSQQSWHWLYSCSVSRTGRAING